MPKKGDNFKRIAQKCVQDFNDNYMEIDDIDGVELSARIAKLLRAEHAWIRRQIRDIERAQSCDNADIHAGVSIALYDLEYRLTQRRK